MACFRAIWLALVVAAATIAAADDQPPQQVDWPQWRGPNRDGVSTETGLMQQWPATGPDLAWKTGGLGQGYSSLSIQNGRIFTMGERAGQECVFALDLDDGKELWCMPIGKTADNAGYPGPRCTPTADNKLVYAIGSHGDLAGYDAATGVAKWRKNLPADFGGKMMSIWGFSESPLVDGDKLVCTPGGDKAMLVALNKQTGEEIWRCAMPNIGTKGKDGAGYSSIVVSNGGGKKQYVQFVGRGLIGVDADSGKFLWGYNKIANAVANISTPVVRDDLVFASAAYESGAAQVRLVAADDGVRADEVYFIQPKDFQNHHGGVVLVGDYLYGGNGQQNGFPTCIEWKAGRIVWGGKQRGPGSGSAAVTYADNRIYFRFEDGTMALIGATPEEYKVYGTFAIPGVSSPSWSYPVVADGKVYLREQDSLLCYKVK